MRVLSQPTIGMDLEDFRRLGVRPHECRLTVIREAAARSAGALARKQLESPSPQIGLQLSRVATSAYRLLDPRKREDASQRVYVGRIVPTALQWAGRTGFHHPGKPSSAPFERESTGDMIEAISLDSPPPLQSDAETWASRLKQDDLHDLRATRQRRIGWRVPVGMIVIAGLAISSVVAFATLDSRGKSSNDTVAEKPKAATPRPLPENSDAAESTVVSPNGIDATNEMVAVENPFAEEPDLLPDPFVRSASGATTTSPPVMSPDDPPPADDVVVAPDATAPPTMDTAENAPPPVAQPQPRFPVPRDDTIRASRERLLALLPELDLSAPSTEAESRIAQIESLRAGLDAGSADDWAAQMMIAELAWLIEDLAGVDRRLDDLTGRYEIQRHSLLAESFIAACDLASLPETRQHLLSNSLPLADRTLVNESTQQCIRVVQAIRPVADLLDGDGLEEDLQQFWNSAIQMERLAASSRRIIEEAASNDGEHANAGIVGRYYCLMLRRWDTGLPWLAKVTDPRIANVARQELELPEDAPTEDLVAVTERWLALADRLAGRSSDSIRLHAVDLLTRAGNRATGLQKLEIERTIDDVLELLPVFLRPDPVSSSSVTSAQESEAMAAAPDASPAPKQGLSGRLMIDGKDVGVQLDYQLDVAFTQAVLDSIAERLNRTLPPMTILLVGEFELEDPGVIVVTLAPGPPDVQQVIKVDGVEVDWASGEENVDVSLDSGKHEVVWLIEAQSFPRLYLRLRDAVTGRRLSVVQPRGSADAAVNTVLTVAMVRATP